ncbi:class I lanthipeptide [Chitinophaga varians]|uniref:class I lanthipeptide n=1 Tax=Chitinophaga varians TaxID=2202339 RepID=UPI00165FA2F6|nr:class I lanthipeptide [Chitinophaga varians]MBC9909523.1 class I lanthipeptide [Chitinophaga varians]
MKKKKVAIDRKMTLGKSLIASLNSSQQELIAGGTSVTYTVTCNCPTRDTSPGTTRPCIYCTTTAV